MTIDIFVIRGAGDRPGDDVVDGLIGSLPVALARGRAELDERAQPLVPVTIEAVFRDGLRLGHTLRCQDSVRGTWAGKITGITHRATGGALSTAVQMRRPA
jgi:hypothetical protein